jgi:hypothetical protein
MLTKNSSSALVQVSRVSGQQVFFDAGDSLGLNQSAAADGTANELRNSAPVDTTPGSGCCVSTIATRVRLITYYLDVATDPRRPRLVRRINNGSGLTAATTFDNGLGTVVAFDVENLTISYDLAAPDGINNPTNVRMTDADLDGSGACAPDPCSANQIRKVNFILSGRSSRPMRGTNQYFRNRLSTQVSLRSLSFVDRYQ